MRCSDDAEKPKNHAPSFSRIFQSSNQHSTVVKSPFFKKKTCVLWERFPVRRDVFHKYMIVPLHPCTSACKSLYLMWEHPFGKSLSTLPPFLCGTQHFKKTVEAMGYGKGVNTEPILFNPFSGIKPYQTIPFLGMILSQSHKYWIAGIRIPRCQTVDRIHGFQDS